MNIQTLLSVCVYKENRYLNKNLNYQHVFVNQSSDFLKYEI